MGKKARLKKEKKLPPDNGGTAIAAVGSKAGDSAKKFAVIAAFLLILALGITLRLCNITNVTGRTPDEQIYAYQARMILQQGAVAGARSLAQEYGGHKNLWIYPPPVRLGYLRLFAAAMKMAKSTDVKVGAYLSSIFSILSLLLLVILGLRFFNKWIALYALLFMSVSPMSLAIARRTWQDSMLGFFGLLLVYLCCELTRAANKLILYILFILAGSYCMLIKESGAVIYGLCAAWLLWILFVKEKSFLKGCLLTISIGIGAAASVAILAYAVGGISTLFEILKRVKETIPINPYGLQYQSGPWYQFLEGFWMVSPLSAALFIAGMASALKKNRDAVLGIIIFTAAFMAIAIASPSCQNLRYVSALFAPFYLIGGLGLWSVGSFIKAKLDNFSFSILLIFIVAGVIAAAAGDYRNFKSMFIDKGLPDMAVGLMKEWRR